MQVLVAASHDACDLVAVAEVGYEFLIFNASIDDYLVEGRAALTHKVNGVVPDLKGREWEIPEFNSFIHHVHSCEEPCLDVVPDVGCPNLDLMQKRRVLRA